MPAAESLAHVLTMRFRHWDRDHSGFLERSDFEEAARRLGTAFGRPADSPELADLIEACSRFWQTLVAHADLNQDERVSEDEFVAAFRDRVFADLDTFDRVYRTMLDTVVKLADVDGDGKLNRDEYVVLMRNWYNTAESDALEMFRRLDLDGDGLLTMDELVSSATNFYLGNEMLVDIPPLAPSA
jgi:Ca2+-binding EF-hand superfamily protein